MTSPASPLTNDEAAAQASDFAVARARGSDPGWVYFLSARRARLIKIGFAVDVKRRLVALQAMSPVPLDLKAIIEGGRGLEAALHRRFANCRSHAEWFHALAPLVDFVRALPFPPASQVNAEHPEPGP